MSLQDWQLALAELVIARAGESEPPRELRGLSVTPAERGWLATAERSHGFLVTCAVQRWWRAFRIEVSAPLTVAVLGPTRGARLIADYLRACPRPTSFFLREAQRFLAYVADRASADPTVASVAHFERAMLALSQSAGLGARVAGASAPPAHARPHPEAAIVRFSAPPELLLAALVWGRPLPAPEPGDHLLLLAPRLPQLARRASPLEAELLEHVWLAERPFAAPDPHSELGRAFASLWESGALLPAAAPKRHASRVKSACRAQATA